MYIEDKSQGITGPARIGMVSFSKTGKTLQYQVQRFQSLKGRGFKANFACCETDAPFWISGCRKDGADRLYAGGEPVSIDEDVRELYWLSIRECPERVLEATS